MGVAAGGFHFKDAVAYFEDRNIKCTATEVKDEDLFIFLFIQTVGQGRSGRFIDDTQNFQPGNAAGIFCGLALTVIKVGRHGDDCLGNGFAQERFSIGFQLGQDHGRDLLR
ncbi:hypothetical protein SDC9_107343 [bioreactor metagenome]|uniref:Uncharacterized protein n=1 Tax=bioreactor metagenome TaxID=1076179 RepID=A0A645B4Z0_9ZZZZ